VPGRAAIVLEVQNEAGLQKLKQFQRGVQDAWQAVAAGDPALKGSAIQVRNLTNAKVDAFKAGQQWQGVLTVLPGQLGSVASQATMLTTALRGPGGLVVAFGAVATASVLLLKSMADDIERLDNLSRQTGLSVSALQAFERAAREAGEGPETLALAFGRVNQAISDLLQGKDAAAKGFEAIGVPLRTMVRDGADVEQILDATAKALAAIPDPTLRAAAQMDLFGARGKAMSTVLAALAKDGIGGYTQAMRDAGIVTSERTNQMAREFDTMADQIGRAARGLATRVKAAMAEALLDTGGFLESISNKILSILRGGGPSLLVGPGTETPIEEDRASRARRPTPRTLAPTPEEQRRLDDIKKRAEAAGSAIAQIFADMDAAMADQVIEPITRAAVDLQKLDEAAQKAEASFRDYTVQFGETRRELLENNRVIDANVGEFQEQGEATGFAARMSAEFNRQLKGLPPSIMALRDAADQLFIRLRDISELGGLHTALDPERLAPMEQAIESVGRAVQAFDTLTDEVLRDLQSNFARFFDDLLSGTLDLEDAFASLAVAMRKSFADVLSASVVQEFQALLHPKVDPTTGQEISTFEGGRGAFAEFAAEMEKTGGDVIQSLKNLSAASAATATAMAAAAGQMVGQQAVGGIFGAPKTQWGGTGRMLGGGAGSMVGGMFGGPAGAFAGGIWGNFVGQLAWETIPMALGLTGGGEDPKWKEMRTAISQALEQGAQEGMAAGMKEALTTGDIAGGLETFKQSLESAILNAIINAFVQAVIVEGVLGPFIQAITAGITDAVKTGFSPESMAAIRSRMDTLRATLASPEFGELWKSAINILGQLFPGMQGIENSSLRISEHTRATREHLMVINEQTAATAAHTRMTAEQTTVMQTQTQALVPATAQVLTAQQLMAMQYMPEQVTAWDEVLKLIGQVETRIDAIAGTEITVPVTFSVGPVPDPNIPLGDRGRQHGLLEGPVPGPVGRPRLMMLHGGETVNTPSQATAILQAIRDRPAGDPEDRRLMLEQNALLRRQNELLLDMGRSRRLVGSRV
jgi:hypothetical protein